MATLLQQIHQVVHELTSLAEAFLVLTTVVVALRFYVRARILKKVAMDDYFMLAAYICYVLTAGITVYLMKLITELFSGGSADIDKLVLVVKVNAAFYIWTMVMLKFSLGFFFLRIFSIHLPQRIIVWFVVLSSLVLSLVYFFMSTFTCGLKSGFLGTQCAAWTAYAGISKAWSWYNASMDMVFSLLSVHALWDAKMTKMTKFWATLVLCLGTAGGVASFVRIIVLTTDSTSTGNPAQGLRSGDWTQVETGMGIIAACLACMRPLLRLLKEKFSSHFTTRATGSITGQSASMASANPDMSQKSETKGETNRRSNLLKGPTSTDEEIPEEDEEAAVGTRS
ncbi:hypothetical protein K461DRAFT_311685 [Myriangium duriaei CBS 260.36]|uniref:Rhodopsin domain-containing protein n=1 Tax=Myriangium duriaei CBS 260.36 TaxID=1168546 RepID=A0A9P4J5G1_9PEZI|nr:hypothetical protein K461DRAFT_311685 [Myriangium duriaei CBS 260.36]